MASRHTSRRPGRGSARPSGARAEGGGAVGVTIERVGRDGEGVAAYEGRDLHVPGAFAGERLVVAVTGRSRQHPRDFGAVRRVLAPHPERRPSPCPRFGLAPGRCGGCPWIELGEEAQRAHARRMLAAHGLEVDEVRASPEAWGYRRASKRVAFRGPEGLTLGSWSLRTHVGAPMRGCRVDHPRLVAAFDELEDAARAQGVAAYDEASGEGQLRYAWAKLEGERLLLTLLTAAGDPGPLAAALRVPDAVAHSRQPHRTNAIRGEAPVWLRGSPGADPLGFSQPNPALIARAHEALLSDDEGAPLGGRLAWDVYAGAGAITRRLRERFDAVVPCERYAPSARALGVAPSDAASFFGAQPGAPELVVANPPRKGMGEAACAALLERAPPRVHLMSCGAAGLARDRARLLAGGYSQRRLLAFQSLPQTPHVELVLTLTRAA